MKNVRHTLRALALLLGYPGEYLRAVLTADRDLVPDDPWAYREARIDAFRNHGIYPSGVTSLFEDALLWLPPEHPIPNAESLNFASLRFQGDPARPASAEELRRQACAFGDLVSRPEFIDHFGMVAPGWHEGEEIDRPCVHSIRSSRRVGPQGQVVFDLVAEVTQRRIVTRHGERFTFYGGSTVILGPDGKDYEAVYTLERQPDGTFKITGCSLRASNALST